MNTAAKKEMVLPVMGLIYHFMTWFFFRLFSLKKMKVYGIEHVPKEGAVILAPNHVSKWDPPLAGCVSPRPVYTVGKAELFASKTLTGKLFAWLIWNMATFPLKRDRLDKTALLMMKRVIANGDALLIFPEGTRTPNGEIQDAAEGFGAMALKMDCPVVPVYLHGTAHSFSKLHPGFRWSVPRVEVYFGMSISFRGYKEAYGEDAGAKASQEIMDAIRDLERNSVN